MRLELRYRDVSRVSFGTPSGLRDGVLYVDRDALSAEILSDPRVASVDVELVDRDDDCRIVSVFDVVQPRCKEDPEGADYPGALGPVQASGVGITRVLRGVAVTVSATEGGRRLLNLRPPLIRYWRSSTTSRIEPKSRCQALRAPPRRLRLPTCATSWSHW